MSRLTYIRLELKRNLKLIPYLIAGAIALSVVIGVIAFCADKLMYSKRIDEKKGLVFASEDESTLTDMVVSTLSKAQSISALFDIQRVTPKKAEHMALKDEVIAGVVIPENFADSLVIGKTKPITIYFSSSNSIYSLIITEISLAAQTSLKSAQSGLYLAYDYYSDRPDAKATADSELTATYLTQALFRDNIFTRIVISATGSLDTKTFYISSGIMIIMLLLGCIFILRTKNTTRIIPIKLCQNGVSEFTQALTTIFCIFITLYSIFISAVLILLGVNAFLGLHLNLTFTSTVVNGILLCLCCSSIITFAGAAMQSKLSAILLLFIVSVGCAFVSGAFIPSVFLPDSFTAVAKYLPTTYLLNTTGLVITGVLVRDNMIIVLKFIAGFVIADIILYYYTVFALRNFDGRDNS